MKTRPTWRPKSAWRQSKLIHFDPILSELEPRRFPQYACSQFVGTAADSIGTVINFHQSKTWHWLLTLILAGMGVALFGGLLTAAHFTFHPHCQRHCLSLRPYTYAPPLIQSQKEILKVNAAIWYYFDGFPMSPFTPIAKGTFWVFVPQTLHICSTPHSILQVILEILSS